MLKEDWPHDDAVKLVDEEVERYKHTLDARHTKYKIVAEEKQADGDKVQ